MVANIHVSLSNRYSVFISFLQQPPTRVVRKMVPQKFRLVLHSRILLKYFNIRSELLDDGFNIGSDNISNFSAFQKKKIMGSSESHN